VNTSDNIFITGHLGMVGSSFNRVLEKRNFKNLIIADRNQLDLRNQYNVLSFFEKNKPTVIIMSAAKVGGIAANMADPVGFLLDNLIIQNNLFDAAIKNNVKEIIFLGSSCIYPAACPQPMKEEYLLDGPLEPTNEGYAIAKIAGLKLAQYIAEQKGVRSISFMPCNLYGTNDHFDLNRAHVLSSLVRRFVDAVDSHANEITLWGTGIARREFMHVDDLAEAVIYLESKASNGSFINVGTGHDISIFELAHLIANLTGFEGEIKWDASKPNGMLQKLMDVSKMEQYGFIPKITLEEGVKKTISEYKLLKNQGCLN